MSERMNYALKEEIRAYWSARAESFDQSVGHAIKSDAELAAWRRVLGDALGQHPLSVLDLACGTGEVTRALLAAGHRVTAIDFSEAMIAKARAKHGAAASIYLCDAERLTEDDERFDALVTRHLVWTLTDPQAAFAEWHRVLKPGGRLVVIDGDWANVSRLGRLMYLLSDLMRAWAGADRHTPPDQLDTHKAILGRLPFGDGLTFQRLSAMLLAAGFSSVRPLDHRPILRAQQRHAPLHDALRLAASRRFALVATR
ncbi:class I SAM-dependent methyltransferase [Chelatococcus sp. SYSU_G07232]|uniref:Class I SAM-dependent methyltransferase n=1 Tax=Chelatococcus albus TaxID=3047466 RepID=A0ABT7AB98_9HYPH|nr:class I SAM-dependent methyltransferase [Chelatococcus sp. SYSU_G07232]MDJ1156646.1 class I SAM-dependent methyltransferase [Chelatococcus sp. SYSU_G07232]